MKALVIDDSRVMRRIVAATLEDLGFECVHAGDGQEAVDILEQDPDFDLACIDWNMPVMNGIEFLRALRISSGGDAPKVVFCTTENEMSFIQEAISAGANEYIMKPFDREIVEGKLAQIEAL